MPDTKATARCIRRAWWSFNRKVGWLPVSVLRAGYTFGTLTWMHWRNRKSRVTPPAASPRR